MNDLGHESPSETPPAASPRPSDSVRNWLLILHLSPFITYMGFFIIGNIVAPLVVWLIKKQEMPEIDRHGKAVLNFQITVSIVTIILIPFCYILIGIPLLFALHVFNVVMVIKAAIKANEGELIKFPFAINFIK